MSQDVSSDVRLSMTRNARAWRAGMVTTGAAVNPSEMAWRVNGSAVLRCASGSPSRRGWGLVLRRGVRGGGVGRGGLPVGVAREIDRGSVAAHGLAVEEAVDLIVVRAEFVRGGWYCQLPRM